MKISGCTIARNVERFQYPVLESIRSILPICDEFIVNIGDSEDNTEAIIRSLREPKIKIIRSTWDMRMGKEVLSHQTNLALRACGGDWAFYLQSDEVIHEADLPRLRRLMEQHKDRPVDVLRFKWLHFYGSYYRYRIDAGWYQKQDRIVRLNGEVESFGDAFGFRRTDGRPLRRVSTGCLLYHYGWVQNPEVMARRRRNAAAIGYAAESAPENNPAYEFGNLRRFPVYFGRHPAVMRERVESHALTRQDYSTVRRQYWYHPGFWLGWRYKTGRRVKQSIVP